MLGADVEVFEVNAGVALPCGVVVEIKCKAGGNGSAGFDQLRDDAVEALRFGEAVAEQVGLGGENCVGFAFVLGKIADEAKDLWNVGWRCRTEMERVASCRLQVVCCHESCS